MSWVVDTSVLLDIYSADPQFAQASANCLAKFLPDRLLICPVSYIEMAPAFEGNRILQNQFLAEVGVEWPIPWTLTDTEAAHRLWNEHIARKRSGTTAKRPVADVLIEAFAQRFQGIITRNPAHFSMVKVVVP